MRELLMINPAVSLANRTLGSFTFPLPNYYPAQLFSLNPAIRPAVDFTFHHTNSVGSRSGTITDSSCRLYQTALLESISDSIIFVRPKLILSINEQYLGCHGCPGGVKDISQSINQPLISKSVNIRYQLSVIRYQISVSQSILTRPAAAGASPPGRHLADAAGQGGAVFGATLEPPFPAPPQFPPRSVKERGKIGATTGWELGVDKTQL